MSVCFRILFTLLESSFVGQRTSYFVPVSVCCNDFIRQRLNVCTWISTRYLAKLASVNVCVPRVLWTSQEQLCILIRDWQLKDCFRIKNNHEKLARETWECCENSNSLKWPTFLHLVQSGSTWGSFLSANSARATGEWAGCPGTRIMQYQGKGN